MSPKRTNGKVVVSPVKFNAGGNKAKSPSSKKNNATAVKSSSLSRQDEDEAVASRKNNSEGRNLNAPPPQTINQSLQQTPSQPHNTYYQWVHSGLQKKKSPLHIKHWIATVLTLDGRDKFTKVLQYSSRLLGWYFAGLAVRSTVSGGGSISTTTNNNGQMNSQLIYQALSQRFTSLYKALVTSRKAFRMGRSVIEWDKIRSMGWGEYLGYWMTHPLVEGGVNSMDKDEEWRMMGGGGNGQGGQLLLRRDTHPIPEEDEHDVEDEHDIEDDDNSWNGQEPSSVEEKKDDPQQQQLSSTKVISKPGRPILPSRISSNIGWGPSNTTTAVETTSSGEAHHSAPSPPSRTVSEMGRQMYRPYPSTPSSTSFGSYQQLKGTTTTTTTSTVAKQPPTTPGWKLIGGTLKLLGLMGFWTFDNLSFLTSSGFLDPITATTSSSSNGGGGGDSKSSNAIATLRTKRKKRASEYAARCYFMGGLAGLYVNLRSFWIHRNGALREARRMCQLDDSSTTSNDALKKTEQKHFELFLALLKSICDVTVFSNNPGVDLHLKLRGKKNHEGLHCLCGLISAGTVLYNNFPNAE